MKRLKIYQTRLSERFECVGLESACGEFGLEEGGGGGDVGRGRRWGEGT